MMHFKVNAKYSLILALGIISNLPILTSLTLTENESIRMDNERSLTDLNQMSP